MCGDIWPFVARQVDGRRELAIAAAASEGLVLKESLKNATGFDGVTKTKWGFLASMARKSLGTFSSAEEAALAIARAVDMRKRKGAPSEQSSVMTDSVAASVSAGKSKRIAIAAPASPQQSSPSRRRHRKVWC